MHLTPVETDSVLAGQPIQPGPMQEARAVSTALLLRYLGINIGAGDPDRIHAAAEGHDEADCLALLQTVCAEWLCVYAGMTVVASGVAGFGPAGGAGTAVPAPVTMRRIRLPPSAFGVTVLNSARAIGEALRGPAAASLQFVCPPVALFGFLADWLGSVLPTFAVLSGDTAAFDAAVTPLLPTLLRVRPVGDYLRSTLARGAALDGPKLAAALSAALDTAVLWVRPCDKSEPASVPLRQPFRGGGHFPCITSPKLRGSSQELISTYSTARAEVRGVSAPDLHQALINGTAVAVVGSHGAGVATVIVSNAASPAPLLEAVLHACAETMVPAAVALGAPLRAVEAAAAGLCFTHAAQAVEAVRAVYASHAAPPTPQSPV